MAVRDDIRIQQAHDQPIEDVVNRLEIVGLTRTSGELVGPCPRCGGTDRFAVNLKKGVFQCRKECGDNCKGDQIALAQLVLGRSFADALEWLVGPREEVSEAERRKIEERAEANRRRRAEDAARRRADAIRAALGIWDAARPAEGTPVRAYLARRGIPALLLAAMPQALRYMADCPYTVPDEDRPGQWRVIHRGPAMIAGVLCPAGRLTAVHRTWIDPDQPSGKARIVDPADRIPADRLPAKKVLGSKKGGAICLRTPSAASTLVMGEGIETTLSALIAEDPPMRAAFWSGVDLGNMAGQRRLGQGLKYAGIPDMEDTDAFVPPPWVRHLVFIQDGDSDPRLTRAKLQAGLRRAMLLRPGLTGSIVHAGEGRDLNDVLRGQP